MMPLAAAVLYNRLIGPRQIKRARQRAAGIVFWMRVARNIERLEKETK